MPFVFLGIAALLVLYGLFLHVPLVGAGAYLLAITAFFAVLLPTRGEAPAWEAMAQPSRAA